MVEQFCDFLAGKREEVVARFQALLKVASPRRDYERAAKLRDQIRRLESILARQRMVDVSSASADVLGVARGAHLEAIRARGLRFRTPDADRVASFPTAASVAEVSYNFV